MAVLFITYRQAWRQGFEKVSVRATPSQLIEPARVLHQVVSKQKDHNGVGREQKRPNAVYVGGPSAMCCLSVNVNATHTAHLVMTRRGLRTRSTRSVLTIDRLTACVDAAQRHNAHAMTHISHLYHGKVSTICCEVMWRVSINATGPQYE